MIDLESSDCRLKQHTSVLLTWSLRTLWPGKASESCTQRQVDAAEDALQIILNYFHYESFCTKCNPTAYEYEINTELFVHRFNVSLASLLLQCANSGQWDQATTSYRTLTRLVSSSQDTTLKSRLPQFIRRYGEAALKAGLYEEAEACFLKLLSSTDLGNMSHHGGGAVSDVLCFQSWTTPGPFAAPIVFRDFVWSCCLVLCAAHSHFHHMSLLLDLQGTLNTSISSVCWQTLSWVRTGLSLSWRYKPC
jgi:hypothetical protein